MINPFHPVSLMVQFYPKPKSQSTFTEKIENCKKGSGLRNMECVDWQLKCVLFDLYGYTRYRSDGLWRETCDYSNKAWILVAKKYLRCVWSLVGTLFYEIWHFKKAQITLKTREYHKFFLILNVEYSLFIMTCRNLWQDWPKPIDLGNGVTDWTRLILLWNAFH